MKTWQTKYREKLVSAERAVAHIEPGDDLFLPLSPGEPPALVKALSSYKGLKNNRLFSMISSLPVVKRNTDELRVISMFLGKDERRAFNQGEIDLLPNHFSDVPEIVKEITDQRVIMATVSPMDENGYFSLGTNSDYISTLLPEAKTVLVEVNEYMPRTFGENLIPISQVTAIVENHQPLPEAPEPVVTEKDAQIGRYVAGLIQDGDSLQIGFGSIPNAVMEFLKDHKDLTIFTEMLPDKIVDLYKSGAISNRNRLDYPGKMTATFAFGTRRLYEFMHENPDIYMLPVNKTNDISKIAATENIVAINATVEVDFLGQCNSERIAGMYWSSAGGQADFLIGARLAKRGRGVICLHSTAKNDQFSKIVSVLPPGSPVTTSKNDVDYVVTEYGVAKLRGKTIRKRTKELIQIAHPKFREELTFQAKKMGYLL